MLDVDVLSGRIVAAGIAPGLEGSNANCSSQCLSGCGTEESIRRNSCVLVDPLSDVSAYFFQMKLLKIDNIMFFVKDLEKSAKFYENIFGLKRIWTDKKMIGFKMGDSEIVIHSDPKIPNPDYSFLVDDVKKFCAGYPGKIIKRPFDVRCGKFAVLADLDGNAINIVDLTYIS